MLLNIMHRTALQINYLLPNDDCVLVKPYSRASPAPMLRKDPEHRQLLSQHSSILNGQEVHLEI